jgi:hypothetical protein
MRLAFFSLVALLTAFACSSGPTAAPAELDMALKTARDNALYNAKLWRSASPVYANYDIMARGDSSQTSTCPQGDGWATIELVSLSGGSKMTLKCSTWSAGKGCIDEAHFKASPDAMTDKMCQSTNVVPYPLPTIAQ